MEELESDLIWKPLYFLNNRRPQDKQRVAADPLTWDALVTAAMNTAPINAHIFNNSQFHARDVSVTVHNTSNYCAGLFEDCRQRWPKEILLSQLSKVHYCLMRWKSHTFIDFKEGQDPRTQHSIACKRYLKQVVKSSTTGEQFQAILKKWALPRWKYKKTDRDQARRDVLELRNFRKEKCKDDFELARKIILGEA